ncbi:hypothetical protein MZM54_04840 [[Brevibacterium] frigoritolerans]|nr:hypothetical protein [Peribacillus frigoritolerans]
MHSLNPLKAKINYYHPFVYRDPVLNTLENAFFLNSNGQQTFFLHSYTYQYFKHRNKLNELRKFSHFRSIYGTSFEDKEDSFYENEILFCRHLPSEYIKGSVNEYIGSDIPLNLLSIELPTEWEHHINVVFEIYECSKMEVFKKDPFLLDWVLYATDKLSTLPLRQEIRDELLAILCKCTLPEGIQEQLSIVIPFHSDPKKHNAIYYEMLTKQF